MGFITPSLLASACFWDFREIIFNLWIYIVWRRISDEGSLPEMCKWSILLIKSDLKWCIHLSRSPFLYHRRWEGEGGYGRFLGGRRRQFTGNFLLEEEMPFYRNSLRNPLRRQLIAHSLVVETSAYRRCPWRMGRCQLTGDSLGEGEVLPRFLSSMSSELALFEAANFFLRLTAENVYFSSGLEEPGMAKGKKNI